MTSTAKLNACGQRWVNELANCDADCLSKAPLDIAKYMDLCTKEAYVSEISTILSNSKHQKSPTKIFVNKVAVEKSFVEIQNQFMDVKDNHLTDQERIKQAQEQDPVVSRVIDLVRTKKRPTRQQRKREPKEVIQLLNHWSRLDLNAKGLLVRRSKSNFVPSPFFVHCPYKGRINRAESVLTGLKPYWSWFLASVTAFKNGEKPEILVRQ